MRCRLIVGFMVLALVIAGTACGAYAEKQWISVSGSTAGERPTVEVINSNASETMIRIAIPGFWLETITEDGVTYDMLRFPGYGTTLDIGKPELPEISELIAIPARSGVKVHVLDYETVTLTGYNIYPHQKPLYIGEKRTSLAIDHGFYERDGLYPDPVSTGKPAIWRDLRVTNLRVAPVRYNPSRKELTVYSSMRVRIEYAGESNINAKNRPVTAVRPQHAAMYGRNILNYDELDIPIMAAPPVDGYDLLIIANDEYLDDLETFVDWKEEKGYRVKLVSILEAGGSWYGFIKDFLQSEYDTYHISYCLLASSGIHYYPIDTGKSDFPYTLLEGDDSLPDIGVGRFPAQNETQLGHMINKSIAFESNPADGGWDSRGLLVANFEGAPGGFQANCETVRIGEYTEGGCYYAMHPLEFVTAYGAEEALGGDGATNQDVIDHIDAGTRFVSFFGHGDYNSGWALWNDEFEDFDQGCIDQLDNGSMTPVVFSMACKTAAPVEDGFGQYFVQQDDGAVAYYGATVLTSTISNVICYMGLVGLFDQGVPAISDATNEGTIYMIVEYGQYGIEISDDYLWYGDPTLNAIPSGDAFHNILPPAPELVSPEWAECIESPSEVVLVWKESGKISGKTTWASHYQLQLDDDPDFTSPIIDNEYFESGITTPLLEQGIYYWRVRSFFTPEYGPWSPARHFFVGMPVAMTQLVSPGDHARVSPISHEITFSWENDLLPTEYVFQLDDGSDFSSPIVHHSTGQTSYTVDMEDLPDGTYYWRVRGAVSAAWPWSEIWSLNYVESSNNNNNNNKPDVTAFPNPFNPSTVIRFELPKSGQVRLDIFNINGALITTLVDGVREAGRHDVLWNGRDAKGLPVASGVYFYRLKASKMVVTKKLMLLR